MYREACRLLIACTHCGSVFRLSLSRPLVRFSFISFFGKVAALVEMGVSFSQSLSSLLS